MTKDEIVKSLVGNNDRNWPFHVLAERARQLLEGSKVIEPGQDLTGLHIAPGALTIARLENEAEGGQILAYDVQKFSAPILVGPDGTQLDYAVKPQQATPIPEEPGQVYDFTVGFTPLQPEIDPGRLVEAVRGSFKVSEVGRESGDVSGLDLITDTLQAEKVVTGTLKRPGPMSLSNWRKDTFEVTFEDLNAFCQSIGVSVDEYRQRYGEVISPVFGAYLFVNPMTGMGIASLSKFLKDAAKLYNDSDPSLQATAERLEVSKMYRSQLMRSNMENPIPFESSAAITVWTKTVDARTKFMKRAGVINENYLCSAIFDEKGNPSVAGLARAVRYAKLKTE